MIKNILSAGCLSLVLLIPVPALALTADQVPNPRQSNGSWVTDMADVITPATEAEINRLISHLEAENGSEIAVVTVPTTSPSTPKEFATALFNTWKVGKAGQDNGVLFLISIGDRRTEIETGYGVESILPDAKAGRIIREDVLPNFKQGNYDQGILAGTQSLVAVLQEGAYSPTTDSTSANEESWYLKLGAAVTAVLAALGYHRMGKAARRPVFIASHGYTRDNGIPNISQEIYIGALAAVLGGGAAVGLVLWIATDLGLFPIALIVGIGGFILYCFLMGRVTGKSKSSFLQPPNCDLHQQPLQELSQKAVEAQLTHPEQVAQKLGSVEFDGWRCPECYPQLTNSAKRSTRGSGEGCHLYAHVLANSFNKKFSECRICQELTVTQEERVLEQATQSQTGKRLIITECQSCFDRHEREEKIPRLPTPVVVVSSGSSGYGSGGYDSGSSSSSSGGDFGGGSSGGGGAGDSW